MLYIYIYINPTVISYSLKPNIKVYGNAFLIINLLNSDRIQIRMCLHHSV